MQPIFYQGKWMDAILPNTGALHFAICFLPSLFVSFEEGKMGKRSKGGKAVMQGVWALSLFFVTLCFSPGRW